MSTSPAIWPNQSRWSNAARFYLASSIKFTCTFITGCLCAGPYASGHLYDKVMELRSEGLGYRRIAQRLNSEEILTPRGKMWHPSSVYSLIKKRKIRDERLNHVPQYKYSDFELEVIEMTRWDES